MIQKPRGTMDILPKDSGVWQFIEKTARETAEQFGFSEIRFPAFESTELFQRGVGDTTDVVTKEMYSFTDREGRSLTLRPEGTASVARCVIENGLCSEPMPLKLFYNINCFRYEKPQAGRSREFFQFGAELFGSDDASSDAEMISLAYSFIKKLGIKTVKLHVNSIGCPTCRPDYRNALKEHFKSHFDELCDTCKERLEKNPLRILDCKSPVCSGIAKDAPKTVDHLCPDCKAHLEKLEKLLKKAGIPYEIDPQIVRGLDYYTRTVFEFICEDIGAQSTICGGGRYDGLIKELGGPALSGIGFAAGITRLILAMEKCNVLPETQNRPILYVAPMGDDALEYAFGIVDFLRKKGLKCECDLLGRSIKAQMKYADKKQAKFTLVVGGSELETGKAKLRNMDESTETEITLSDFDGIYEIIK